MTRKLEELLGLPPMTEAKLKEIQENQPDDDDIDGDDIQGGPLTTTTAATPPLPVPVSDDVMTVTPVQMAQHEAEMEEIAQKAITTFDEMKDLAFGVEAKSAGQIFEPMVQMLQLAMNAKAAKLDKRMKMMRLQLDKDRLEHQKAMTPTEGFVEGEAQPGMLLDRNDLLAQLGPKKNT